MKIKFSEVIGIGENSVKAVVSINNRFISYLTGCYAKKI